MPEIEPLGAIYLKTEVSLSKIYVEKMKRIVRFDIS